jgi:hypothetical protein
MMPYAYAEEFLPLWYNALEEEIGLYVRSRPEDRMKLVNCLYEGRQAAGDEALAELMIFQIGDDVIYIAKRSAELPE